MSNDLGKERIKAPARFESTEALSVLDEDAWEDAIDESEVDYDALCHSQRSGSMQWLFE